MTAIPTELLDLVKKYSTLIYWGTVVVAVVSVLALCLALTSVYDGHLSNRDFFVAGAIFLLLYYVLHRMFVWQSSTQHASELATPLNIVFPVLVFALQSSISFSFIFTALNYLNASPNFCTSQQLQLWKWRDFVSLFLFFIVIGGLFAFLLWVF